MRRNDNSPNRHRNKKPTSFLDAGFFILLIRGEFHRAAQNITVIYLRTFVRRRYKGNHFYQRNDWRRFCQRNG